MNRRTFITASTSARMTGSRAFPDALNMEEFITYAQKQKGVVFMRKDKIAKWALSAPKIPHES